MKKRILFRCLYLLVGLLLLVNTSQLVAASLGDKDGEPVENDGDWTEGNRSLSDSIPVQLYWDGTNLYIENPSGRSEIHYANRLFPALGLVEKDSIYAIIRKEITEGQSWLRIRTQSPCDTCVYQWLCPSPSDYEIELNRPNLCLTK